MTPKVVRKGLYRALDQIRHVTPVRPGQARGLVAEVYSQVERDFGMLAPPIALHSPAPTVLAASWVMLRETLVSPGTVDKASREAVASAVSLSNRCPYCVDVHTASLRGLAMGADASALAAGQPDSIADPRRREYARLAYAGVPGDLPAELVGVAVTFHYLNRMVNVFMSDSVLPSEVPGFARRPMMGLMGRMVGAAARRAVPGESLSLLPPASTPGDLAAWAAGSPLVADALSRAAATIDASAAPLLSASARDLVLARIACWDGRPPGLSSDWLTEAVTDLPPREHAAARLALSIAFTSYRTTAAEIAEFRRIQPQDTALIELAAWSSLSTARHMATRLTADPVP